jgi:prolyl oligopeptidase PreP (S9A serine peptidase family)
MGENDRRYQPGHIFKFTTELQNNQAEGQVALLAYLRDMGASTSAEEKRVSRLALKLAFAWAMTA